MLKTNKERLVMQSVQGKIHSPQGSSPYRVDREGFAWVLPATGGITYNVRVGDPCMGWVGDHIEPGVSIKNENAQENMALNFLACIGNEARVVSGDAKGAIGYVTGKHGGIDHVLIHFEEEELNKMAINDTILVKAYGQGLAIEELPQVVCMNLDPRVMDRMPLRIENGRLMVPVVTEIPAHLMGSGLGSATAFSGDYDIMTGDPEANEQYGINRLRFGDLVLLRDCDNTHGRQYLKGAVSVGIVVHSDCIKAGHGPGVTVIFSSKTDCIQGVIDPQANLVNYL